MRASEVKPAGSWSGEAEDSVVLDYDGRFRRRMTLTCVSGKSLLLDLKEAQLLRDGDGLATDEGVIVRVVAAPEKLAEVTFNNPQVLARVAWHLGNRHFPTQVLDGALRFRADHVIVDMVKQLGIEVNLIEAPFDPEGGAYGHGVTHGHSH